MAIPAEAVDVTRAELRTYAPSPWTAVSTPPTDGAPPASGGRYATTLNVRGAADAVAAADHLAQRQCSPRRVARPSFTATAHLDPVHARQHEIEQDDIAVSEPVSYLQEPPVGPGGTPEATQNAMFLTLFHRGLHPWAIYIVLGLALGYFAFRKGLPLRPASALYPLLGDRINRWPGFVVDVLAVFDTLFGLATSLGLGAQQVGAGLETPVRHHQRRHVADRPDPGDHSVAVTSVMLGIGKGIRNLSLVNLWLAFALFVFVFVFGPTHGLLNATVTNFGNNLQNLPARGGAHGAPVPTVRVPGTSLDVGDSSGSSAASRAPASPTVVSRSQGAAARQQVAICLTIYLAA
jgi:hypothetical protein